MALTLYYFPFRGRGEAPRLALEFLGVAYEDARKSGAELFGALKDTIAPYGQYPVLQVGDKYIGQSGTVLKYIARNLGDGKLLAADPVDAAIHESIVDQCGDVVTAFWGAVMTQPEAERPKAVEAFKAEKLGKVLGGILKYLGDKAYFGGEAPLVSDIAVFGLLEVLPSFGLDITAGGAFPQLAAFAERMRARPELAAYFARRAALEAK